MEFNPVVVIMTIGWPNVSSGNLTSNFSGNNTGDNPVNGEDSEAVFKAYNLYKITYYMTEYYLWFVLAFGVPGNLASIFTILSMTTVSSSKTHVAILALTDTVAIIVKVIYWQASGHFVQLTTPGCTIIMFIQQFSTVYPNWVVVAMTTERFLAVWFPLRVGQMYTRRKAIITLATLAFITAAVYLFFCWAWIEKYETGYGYWCEMKHEYVVFTHDDSYYWIEALYYAILPCLLILIGNMLIITNIKRATKIQRHLTNSFDQGGRKARDQRQITVMLVVVSVIFLLLNMPNAVFYIVKRSWKYQENSYEHVKHMFINRFFHVLADANHAVNFYLYFLSMSSFRRRFMDAVRCRNNTYSRRAGGSVSRTSHSFLNSAHHATSFRPRNNNGTYNTCMRSSSKNVHHTLPLEYYKSKPNGVALSHQIKGFHESLTNVSEV
ncbi:hypothetical protein BsWGS_21001 [Bradybaena similaris]